MDPVSEVYKEKIARFTKSLKLLSSDRDVSIADLQEFHQGGVHIIKKKFADTPKLDPLWILYTKDKELMIITVSWADNTEKEWAIRFMKDWMQTIHTKYFCFATEAWVVTIKADDEAKREQDLKKLIGKVSTDPRRIEVLLVSSEDAKGNFYSSMFNIIRDGWKVSLETPKENSGTVKSDSGRFTGLLMPSKPLP